MLTKAFSEMTVPELHAELAAARQARFAADYMEGLFAWRVAIEAADHRIDLVKTEIERRGGVEKGQANG